MRPARTSALVVAVHLLVGVARAADPAPVGGVAVVVGKASDVDGITLDGLRDVYLRRRRVWPDGSRVIPVNLPPDTPVRDAFSKRVLGRLPRDLGSYWDHRYFEGIRPPLVLRSPDAVSAYLAVEPKAIGYMRLEDVDRAVCRVLLVLHE